MDDNLKIKKEVESQYKLENEQNESDSNDADKRNGYTWPQSLKMAILSSEDQKLTLAQIYEFIKKEFPYYRTTNREKTDKWKCVVRQNLSGRKEIFQREGPKFGTGQWMVIDEDGKNAKNKLTPSLSPSPKISSPKSPVCPALLASFPARADYAQQVNSKVSPPLPQFFPIDANYLQAKAKIARNNRIAFASNYAIDRASIQTKMDTAIRSFNFAYAEQLRRHRDDADRQHMDSLNQYYQLEINYLLQLKFSGALRLEDDDALDTFSKVVPNIYHTEYLSLCNAYHVPISGYVMPKFNSPIQEVQQSKLNTQESPVRNSFNSMPIRPIPCYAVPQASYRMHQMTHNNLNQQESQITNYCELEDGEPLQKRFKSNRCNTLRK